MQDLDQAKDQGTRASHLKNHDKEITPVTHDGGEVDDEICPLEPLKVGLRSMSMSKP